jgi:hypothetical protein
VAFAAERPPISAPLGPTLTLAMPQALPAADTNVSASRTSVVKMLEDSPCSAVLDGDGLFELVIGMT